MFCEDQFAAVNLQYTETEQRVVRAITDLQSLPVDTVQEQLIVL